MVLPPRYSEQTNPPCKRFRCDAHSDKFALKREPICRDNVGLDWGGNGSGNCAADFHDLLVGRNILGFISDDLCLRIVSDPDEFFLPRGLPGRGRADEGCADV
jgi:hypothetical protein